MSPPTWNPDHPLIGRLLINRFQIASFIREGGMAQVFCAVQSQEPRHVAVKLMHPELADDPEIVARFMREAHTASRLEHPNIVRVVGFGEDTELLFMAMELLFGDDLSARVKLKGSFSDARAVEIMVDVCTALEHAHSRGVIHRDIKPENVMLARQPNAPETEVVKVLDFGIAKILDAQPDFELAQEAPTGIRSVLTRVGSWVGTPAYMSPEQGTALPVDHRSDIYSAGVLLFELVCGRPPYEGQTPLQILARHVHDPVPQPSQFARVAPRLERAMVRALAKNPDERFPSARAFADELRAILPDLGADSSQRWGEQRRGIGNAATMLADERPAAAPPSVVSADADSSVTRSRRSVQRTVALELPPQTPTPRESPSTDSVRSPRQAHPLVGRMLKEKYMVASFIREGSMAHVFCGLSEVEPRHVAIKVVRPDLADDKQIVGRFLREGQVAARLSHPNIVRVVEVGEDNDILFMVMELLHGDDLSARIKQRGSFTQLRALQIAADICAALEHAHARGIVHRDVKPENVMLARQPDAPELEVVKVLDFGIAKVLDHRPDAPALGEPATGMRSALTRVGTLVGTPTYMSPEQGRAETVDHRSDIYSVGVLLYELVCGKPPFEGETALQIAARHVHETPAMPSSLARMPTALNALIMRTLAKDPAARPQSAGELREALLAIASDLARNTDSGSSSERKLRRTGRGQAIAQATANAQAPVPPPAAAPPLNDTFRSAGDAPAPSSRHGGVGQTARMDSSVLAAMAQARVHAPSPAPLPAPVPQRGAPLQAVAVVPTPQPLSPPKPDGLIKILIAVVVVLLIAVVVVALIAIERERANGDGSGSVGPRTAPPTAHVERELHPDALEERA